MKEPSAVMTSLKSAQRSARKSRECRVRGQEQEAYGRWVVVMWVGGGVVGVTQR